MRTAENAPAFNSNCSPLDEESFIYCLIKEYTYCFYTLFRLGSLIQRIRSWFVAEAGTRVDNSHGAGGARINHPDSSYLLLLQQVIQRISLLLLASLLAWGSTSSTRCCASLQIKIHNTTRTISREHMRFPVPLLSVVNYSTEASV